MNSEQPAIPGFFKQIQACLFFYQAFLLHSNVALNAVCNYFYIVQISAQGWKNNKVQQGWVRIFTLFSLFLSFLQTKQKEIKVELNAYFDAYCSALRNIQCKRQKAALGAL